MRGKMGTLAHVTTAYDSCKGGDGDTSEKQQRLSADLGGPKMPRGSMKFDSVIVIG